MATYIKDKDGAFKKMGDKNTLPSHQRSEARMKNYTSATDSRAWATNGIDKRQYILDLMAAESPKEKPFGKCVPVDVLVKTLLGNKDADIDRLNLLINELMDFINHLYLNKDEEQKYEKIKQRWDAGDMPRVNPIDFKGSKTSRTSSEQRLRAPPTVQETPRTSSESRMQSPRTVDSLAGTDWESPRSMPRKHVPARHYSRPSSSGSKNTDLSQNLSPSDTMHSLPRIIPQRVESISTYVQTPVISYEMSETQTLEVELNEIGVQMTPVKPEIAKKTSGSLRSRIPVPGPTGDVRSAKITQTPVISVVDINVIESDRNVFVNRQCPDCERNLLVTKEAFAEMDQLKAAIETLKQKLETTENELQTIKNDPWDKDKVDEDIQSMASQIRKLRETGCNDELKIVSSELQLLKKYCQKLMYIKTENKKLKQENTNLRNQRLGQSRSATSLQEHHQKPVSIHDCLNTRRLDYSNEVSLRAKLQAKIQVLREVTREKNDLVKDLEKLKERSNMLDSVLEEKIDLERRVHKMAQVEKDMTILKMRAEKADELQRALENAQKNLLYLKEKQVPLMFDHNVPVVEELKHKTREAEVLRVDRDRIAIRLQELSHIEQEHIALQNKCRMFDALRKERDIYKTKSIELANLKQEYNTLREQMNQVHALSEEREKANQRLCQLECVIADQENEISRLVMHIDRLSKNAENKQDRIKQIITELRGEIENKNTIITNSEMHLATVQFQLKQTIDTLANETSVLKQQMYDANASCTVLKARLERLSNQLTEAYIALEKEKKTSSLYKQEVITLCRENERLQEIANAVNELTDTGKLESIVKQSGGHREHREHREQTHTTTMGVGTAVNIPTHEDGQVYDQQSDPPPISPREMQILCYDDQQRLEQLLALERQGLITLDNITCICKGDMRHVCACVNKGVQATEQVEQVDHVDHDEPMVQLRKGGATKVPKRPNKTCPVYNRQDDICADDAEFMDRMSYEDKFMIVNLDFIHCECKEELKERCTCADPPPPKVLEKNYKGTCVKMSDRDLCYDNEEYMKDMFELEKIGGISKETLNRIHCLCKINTNTECTCISVETQVNAESDKKETKPEAKDSKEDKDKKPKPESKDIKEDKDKKPKLESKDSKEDKDKKTKPESQETKETEDKKPKPDSKDIKEDKDKKTKPEAKDTKEENKKPKPDSKDSKESEEKKTKPEESEKEKEIVASDDKSPKEPSTSSKGPCAKIIKRDLCYDNEDLYKLVSEYEKRGFSMDKLHCLCRSTLLRDCVCKDTGTQTTQTTQTTQSESKPAKRKMGPVSPFGWEERGPCDRTNDRGICTDNQEFLKHMISAEDKGVISLRRVKCICGASLRDTCSCSSEIQTDPVERINVQTRTDSNQFMRRDMLEREVSFASTSRGADHICVRTESALRQLQQLEQADKLDQDVKCFCKGVQATECVCLKTKRVSQTDPIEQSNVQTRDGSNQVMRHDLLDREDHICVRTESALRQLQQLEHDDKLDQDVKCFCKGVQATECICLKSKQTSQTDPIVQRNVQTRDGSNQVMRQDLLDREDHICVRTESALRQLQQLEQADKLDKDVKCFCKGVQATECVCLKSKQTSQTDPIEQTKVQTRDEQNQVMRQDRLKREMFIPSTSRAGDHICVRSETALRKFQQLEQADKLDKDVKCFCKGVQATECFCLQEDPKEISQQTSKHTTEICVGSDVDQRLQELSKSGKLQLRTQCVCKGVSTDQIRPRDRICVDSESALRELQTLEEAGLLPADIICCCRGVQATDPDLAKRKPKSVECICKTTETDVDPRDLVPKDICVDSESAYRQMQALEDAGLLPKDIICCCKGTQATECVCKAHKDDKEQQIAEMNQDQFRAGVNVGTSSIQDGSAQCRLLDDVDYECLCKSTQSDEYSEPLEIRKSSDGRRVSFDPTQIKMPCVCEDEVTQTDDSKQRSTIQKIPTPPCRKGIAPDDICVDTVQRQRMLQKLEAEGKLSLDNITCVCKGKEKICTCSDSKLGKLRRSGSGSGGVTPPCRRNLSDEKTICVDNYEDQQRFQHLEEEGVLSLEDIVCVCKGGRRKVCKCTSTTTPKITKPTHDEEQQLDDIEEGSAFSLICVESLSEVPRIQALEHQGKISLTKIKCVCKGTQSEICPCANIATSMTQAKPSTTYTSGYSSGTYSEGTGSLSKDFDPCEDLRAQLLRCQNKVKELQNVNDALQSEIKALRVHSSEMKEAAKEQISNLSNELKKSQDSWAKTDDGKTMQDLKEQNKRMQDEIDRLKKLQCICSRLGSAAIGQIEEQSRHPSEVLKYIEELTDGTRASLRPPDTVSKSSKPTSEYPSEYIKYSNQDEDEVPPEKKPRSSHSIPSKVSFYDKDWEDKESPKIEPSDHEDKPVKVLDSDKHPSALVIKEPAKEIEPEKTPSGAAVVGPEIPKELETEKPPSKTVVDEPETIKKVESEKGPSKLSVKIPSLEKVESEKLPSETVVVRPESPKEVESEKDLSETIIEGPESPKKIESKIRPSETAVERPESPKKIESKIRPSETAVVGPEPSKEETKKPPSTTAVDEPETLKKVESEKRPSRLSVKEPEPIKKVESDKRPSEAVVVGPEPSKSVVPDKRPSDKGPELIKKPSLHKVPSKIRPSRTESKIRPSKEKSKEVIKPEEQIEKPPKELEPQKQDKPSLTDKPMSEGKDEAMGKQLDNCMDELDALRAQLDKCRQELEEQKKASVIEKGPEQVPAKELKDQNADLQKQLENLKKELANSKEELQKERSAPKLPSDDVDDLRAQLEALRKQLEDANKRLQDCEKHLEEEKQKLEEERNKKPADLNKELDDLKKQLENSQQELKQAKEPDATKAPSTTGPSQKDYDDLLKKLEAEKAKHDAGVSKDPGLEAAPGGPSQQDLDDLLKKLADCREQLDKEKQKADDLKKQLEDARKQPESTKGPDVVTGPTQKEPAEKGPTGPSQKDLDDLLKQLADCRQQLEEEKKKVKEVEPAKKPDVAKEATAKPEVEQKQVETVKDGPKGPSQSDYDDLLKKLADCRQELEKERSITKGPADNKELDDLRKQLADAKKQISVSKVPGGPVGGGPAGPGGPSQQDYDDLLKKLAACQEQLETEKKKTKDGVPTKGPEKLPSKEEEKPEKLDASDKDLPKQPDKKKPEEVAKVSATPSDEVTKPDSELPIEDATKPDDEPETGKPVEALVSKTGKSATKHEPSLLQDSGTQSDIVTGKPDSTGKGRKPDKEPSKAQVDKLKKELHDSKHKNDVLTSQLKESQSKIHTLEKEISKIKEQSMDAIRSARSSFERDLISMQERYSEGIESLQASHEEMVSQGNQELEEEIESLRQESIEKQATIDELRCRCHEQRQKKATLCEVNFKTMDIRMECVCDDMLFAYLLRKVLYCGLESLSFEDLQYLHTKICDATAKVMQSSKTGNYTLGPCCDYRSRQTQAQTQVAKLQMEVSLERQRLESLKKALEIERSTQAAMTQLYRRQVKYCMPVYGTQAERNVPNYNDSCRCSSAVDLNPKKHCCPETCHLPRDG